MNCINVPATAPLEQTVAAVARVLVVVLNYNGLTDTLACLASLRNQSLRSFRALVIDNGSRADESGPIAASFPEVEVIRLDDNLGWAGGNNVGLRLALEQGCDFVCLLNNDTLLAATALAELLHAAELLGAPCLLHPAIHYFDDPSRAQLCPGLPASADETARQRAALHDIVEMDYAYGACLLLPRAALLTVGLLDERFFLQLEEQDWFRRAALTGMRSYCARRARVLHRESVSFGGRVTPDKMYYQVRNRLLLTEKHDATLGGALRAGRELIWMLQNRVPEPESVVTIWPRFLRWLVSADPLARAARQGACDYARRRFGRRR